MLYPTEPPIIKNAGMGLIAFDDWGWSFRDILHQKPLGLCLSDTPLKLRNEIAIAHLVSIMLNEMSQAAKHLAWWPANDAVKLTGWWMKLVDVTTPQEVRPTDETEALLFKGEVKQPDTWE